MRTYTQLTQAQRYQIYALLKMGHFQTETLSASAWTNPRLVASCAVIGVNVAIAPSKLLVWRCTGADRVSTGSQLKPGL